MGNKNSRRKSASDATDSSSVKRKKKPSKSGSSATSPTDANGKHNKHISCPNLGTGTGGAVPYRLYDEEPKVKYNIYRSYRDLDNNKLIKKEQDTVDFRIYRRSTAEMPSADARSPSHRPQTLPRGFGRSKSAYVEGARAGGTMTPNGAGGEMNYLDWARATAVTPDSDYGGTYRSASEYGGIPGGTMRSGRSSRMSKRSSIASSCGTNISKMTQVVATDFPCTSSIHRKQTYFQEQYAQLLVQKYSQLPQSDQLASLALAIRKRFGQTQTITLLNYMEGENVPSDLLSSKHQESAGKYVLCIPEALFRGLEHVRESGNKKMRLWTTLAKDIVMCVGVESGNELCRMYEYQIALMFDDASIRVLASHAADCVVDYVRNNTYLDRNSAVQGVVSNIPPNPDGHPKYLAVVIGDKEMKWELYDVFKKPGLKKEISLQSDELIVEPDEETLSQDPWTYHYGSGAEPMMYGYRGQLIEWNFYEQMYELNEEEDEKYAEEAMWRPEDFHRLYMPYQRLFGRKAMQTFSKMGKKEDGSPHKLSELLKTEFDGNEERAEIQPVYRPLGKEEKGEAEGEEIVFAGLNLDHMDLSRVKLQGQDVQGISVQHSRLLLADVPKLEWENLTGADVSYSTLDSSLSLERVHDIVARYVTIRRSLSPRVPKQKSVNGVQETNLDQQQFPASPWSPTSPMVLQNDVEYPEKATMVTNSQGQMVPIMQN